MSHVTIAESYLEQLTQIAPEPDLLLTAALIHAVLAVEETLREIGIGPQTGEGLASLIYNAGSS
jgi:hypothetical protein